jgi:hypothetical protein
MSFQPSFITILVLSRTTQTKSPVGAPYSSVGAPSQSWYTVRLAGPRDSRSTAGEGPVCPFPMTARWVKETRTPRSRPTGPASPSLETETMKTSLEGAFHDTRGATRTVHRLPPAEGQSGAREVPGMPQEEVASDWPAEGRGMCAVCRKGEVTTPRTAASPRLAETAFGREPKHLGPLASVRADLRNQSVEGRRLARVLQ